MRPLRVGLSLFYASLSLLAANYPGEAFAQKQPRDHVPKPAAASPSPFSIRLPSGSMTFRSPGRWKWTDSCRSTQVPCYFGSLRSEGTGYLFAGPNPQNPSKSPTADLCRDIFKYHEKSAKSLPPEMRPRSLEVKKNPRGQAYCSWLRGKERTYFWQAGKSLVSISFAPNDREARGKDSQATNAFWMEVAKFAQGVTFDEK